MSSKNIYKDLPRVVMVTSIEDGGPDGTFCPHCGAKGRFIIYFLAENGEQRGAMKGCFRKFPKHPLAAEAAELLERQRERQKKGQQLSGWDQTMLSAIEDYGEYRISEDQAMEIVRMQKARKAAWMKKRRYH